MNTHLTDEELLAVIDGMEAGEAQQHLSTCASCRRRHGEFKATLQLASRLPEVEWTPLQGEILVHGVRRRLRARRAPRRPAWQPALGGALVTGVLAAVAALALVPQGMTPELAPATTIVQDAIPVVSDRQVGVDEQLDDAEFADMIETYLIETASADELLLEFGELSDDEYFALLEE